MIQEAAIRARRCHYSLCLTIPIPALPVIFTATLDLHNAADPTKGIYHLSGPRERCQRVWLLARSLRAQSKVALLHHIHRWDRYLEAQLFFKRLPRTTKVVALRHFRSTSYESDEEGLLPRYLTYSTAVPPRDVYDARSSLVQILTVLCADQQEPRVEHPLRVDSWKSRGERPLCIDPSKPRVKHPPC
ncbi:hypothetical protein BDR04DRAFT_1162330 [Suillus decipiens]|nr:hypothetical protein BDR04DRAFT_1162330 [Suillus decipiens]